MTSFQVEFDGGLPQGLCCACSESALAAINFKKLCKESNERWNQATTFMSEIKPPLPDDKVFYIFYNAEIREIIGDQTEGAANTQRALLRLNSRFQEEIEGDNIIATKRLTAKKFGHKSCFWQCPDCGKQFSVPVHLNSHLKKTTKRACNDCGLVVSKEKFALHITKAHGKIAFSCPVCFELFVDQQSLDAHHSKFHNSNLRQCSLCGNGYSNERALSAHMYSHTLFHCRSCGKCFKNRKCYVYHQRQCKTSMPAPVSTEYKCDHCGNSYTKKPSLRIHIIQKHLRILPYVCETCGKRTSTIGHLRSHEKVHALERKTFQCHCGAKMRTELGYQLHLRIHTGERPYECEECGDRFLSSSRRSDHIKRRHRSAKDMAHGCTECGARFVRPFELKKHYTYIHPELANKVIR